MARIGWIGLTGILLLGQAENETALTPEEARRVATIEEFGDGYFEFAGAFHGALWEQLQAGKITAANYAQNSRAFWAAFDGQATRDFEALYDGATAGAQKLLQAAALRLRQEKRAKAEAAAAKAAEAEAALE